MANTSNHIFFHICSDTKGLIMEFDYSILMEFIPRKHVEKFNSWGEIYHLGNPSDGDILIYYRVSSDVSKNTPVVFTTEEKRIHIKLDDYNAKLVSKKRDSLLGNILKSNTQGN